MHTLVTRIGQLALGVVVALSLASCGDSSAVSDDPDSGERAPTNPGVAETDYDVPWDPPEGREGPQFFEGRAVNLLHANDCDGAQNFIDAQTEDSVPAWSGFTYPRNLLLFQAGIELCRHNDSKAVEWYGEAAEMGWDGTAGDGEVNMCLLYRAVASAIEDRPKDDFMCQPGAPTPDRWTTDATGLRYDDPRTPQDESTDNGGETEPPTGEATDEATDDATDDATGGSDPTPTG